MCVDAFFRKSIYYMLDRYFDINLKNTLLKKIYLYDNYFRVSRRKEKITKQRQNETQNPKGFFCSRKHPYRKP